MPVVDDEVPTNVPSWRRPAATAVQAESEESSESEDSEMHDGGAVDIAPVLPSKRRRRNDKFFGLSTDARTPPTGATRILDPLDYEAKYAPDPINEETAPNARVWRMCADEFAIFDADLSEDNRDTVDVLLVFAGLFSAVVTSFLVLVSAQLQPDYTQLSSSIMYELLVVQRAIGNASSVDLAPVSPSPAIPFVPSQSYIWVNGLWYTSLSLSLITALVASLVKQWMHQYMATTSGTPRDRCMIRQYRYDGYEKWGVSFIVGTLPVLMHLSLGLFFVGLTVYLIQLYLPLAYIPGSLAGITCVAYFVSHAISAIYLQCPYRTPLANLLFVLCTHAEYRITKFFADPLRPISRISFLPFFMRRAIISLNLKLWDTPDIPSCSFRDAESADIGRRPEYAFDVLHWMIKTTANSTARSLIHQAIGGFSFKYTNERLSSYADAFSPDSEELGCLGVQLADANDAGSQAAGQKLERLLRAIVVMDVEVAAFFVMGWRLVASLESVMPEMLPPQLVASAIASGIYSSIEAERVLQHPGLLLHPRLWLCFFQTVLSDTIRLRTIRIAREEQPKPWEMALFFRLCTTPHSILNSFNTEPNPKISDSNAVTYKALFGYKDLNDIIEKIILQYVLSSFDPGVSDAAYGLQIPLPFNWSSSSWVMKDKGFRIQIAIMNYYRFVVLHEEEYRYDQEYPAALNALHGAVHEMLSSFLQLRNSEFEKRHIISLVTTRLFSDLPIPPKWSDLDDIRKKALPLTTGFIFQAAYRGVYEAWFSPSFISSLLAPVLTQEISPSENSHHYIVPAVMMADIRIRSNLPEAFKFLRTNDLLFQAAYRGVYEAWFSPLFISSLLAPVLTQEISPSEDSHHYILPAVVMADIGIRSGLPEAFKFLRTNDLLNNLFPYHRNRPIYSLLARYIAVVCTTYTTVMESHEDTANGTWNQELSENQLLLSTVGSLAQVTILVLAEQEPEMYKVLLRDVWSGDSDALSKEALRDVEVLVTNMIRPESEYWNGLKILDEDISLLRGLREDEHLQLQEELSTRWLTFKDDLDRAQGQDTAGGIEQSSTGMRSDGR